LFMLMLHHLAIVCENVTSFFYKVGVIVYLMSHKLVIVYENVTSFFLQSGSNCLCLC
jgi:hypothetical protein